MVNEKITVIIQARIDSKRLPGKVLLPLSKGLSSIEIIKKRLLKSKILKNIVVAIPDNKINIELENFLVKKKISYFKGSNLNVLKRYYDCAKKNKSRIIVRITADCPCVDFRIIEKSLKLLKEKKFDYVSNTIIPTYPDGLDVEAFTFKTLKKCFYKAKDKYDLEHVTPYIKRNNNFLKKNILNNKNYSKYRVTLDYYEDFIKIKKIFEKFDNKIFFTYNKLQKLLNKQRDMFISKNIIRNEGSSMSENSKLWKRTKEKILGGTMLFSKRPQNFLPEKWPPFYSKAKKCYIWDLQKKKYLDVSLMGIGTNILGYSNKLIDDKVIKAIKSSNMSTLNCFEFTELTEKLLDMHPWFGKAKFAKTGSEANSIALRIARCSAKSQNVAVCGYHGWQDWYLAANIMNNKNLNNHLMTNISSDGVNKSLKKNIFSFNYNDYESFLDIVKKNEIGTVFMEVSRNFKPKNRFLEKIRSYTKKKNIILIYDECSSGFREDYGGLHKKYNVKPDLAVFGKALGNGYPITVVLGDSELMNNAENSFISSTFWTDKIGAVAAIATLDIMEKLKSWKIISLQGNKIKNKWREFSIKYNLEINIFGLDAMPSFTFKSNRDLEYRTLIAQEMLKKNILATNTVYLSIFHDDKILKKYFNVLENIFYNISRIENNIENIKLETPIIQPGFNRIN
jgi:glutamate-1-semialdehyde 2,1-aminomutase